MGLFSVGELAVRIPNARQILWAPSLTSSRVHAAGGQGSGFSNLNKRHFIPTTSVEFVQMPLVSPRSEEEWDISGSTGIAI